MTSDAEREEHESASSSAVAASIPRGKILVVDDEPEIRETVRRILSKEGYEADIAESGRIALDKLESFRPALVLCDYRLPDLDGLQLLHRIKDRHPETEVVLFSGYGTIDSAVQAIRDGAYDFLQKPVKRVTILRTVERVLEKHALLVENRRLREELSEVRGRRDLIAVSETMRRTLDVVQQVAQSSATTLIVGESGTGKEVIANLIHTSSERRDGPFIKVSCAAIPETLLEAELFGHEKGAFTGAVHQRKGRFELAHMGTLFLDEVGEMSPTIQVKLLRVLQEGEFERLGGNQTLRSDVRLITATNVDLEDAVRHGRFRSDLYYRLNVITVPLPPLRERREDIPLLASYFCRRLAAKHGKAIQGVSAAAMERLLQYAWPGNVRELENVVERAVVLGRGTLLAEEDLPPAIHAAVTPSPEIRIPVGMPMREAEDRIIRATLQHTGGNKEQAARLLGIASRTIHRKVGPRNASK